MTEGGGGSRPHTKFAATQVRHNRRKPRNTFTCYRHSSSRVPAYNEAVYVTQHTINEVYPEHSLHHCTNVRSMHHSQAIVAWNEIQNESIHSTYRTYVCSEVSYLVLFFTRISLTNKWTNQENIKISNRATLRQSRTCVTGSRRCGRYAGIHRYTWTIYIVRWFKNGARWWNYYVLGFMRKGRTSQTKGTIFCTHRVVGEEPYLFLFYCICCSLIVFL